jgi:hypothetical protein
MRLIRLRKHLKLNDGIRDLTNVYRHSAMAIKGLIVDPGSGGIGLGRPGLSGTSDGYLTDERAADSSSPGPPKVMTLLPDAVVPLTAKS